MPIGLIGELRGLENTVEFAPGIIMLLPFLFGELVGIDVVYCAASSFLLGVWEMDSKALLALWEVNEVRWFRGGVLVTDCLCTWGVSSSKLMVGTSFCVWVWSICWLRTWTRCSFLITTCSLVFVDMEDMCGLNPSFVDGKFFLICQSPPVPTEVDRKG